MVRKYTKRRNTNRRKSNKRNTNKRNTNKRNTNKRNTKRNSRKVNNKSDINKFIREKIPGYKLIKILNSKQAGGGIYDDYGKVRATALGEGKYGKVYLAKHKATRKKVIIKEFSNPRGSVALDAAKQEFFFGQIVKALTVDNNDLQRKLDTNDELNMNMVVLYKDSEGCDKYLALYRGYNIYRVYSNTHKLLVFDVDTNHRETCDGGRKGTPGFTAEMLGYGGYKLFSGKRRCSLTYRKAP